MSAATFLATVGVLLLLLAFALNSRGMLQASDPLYLAMNAVGAGLSCFASALIGFVPFVALEAVWCAVAVVGLARLRWGSVAT